MKKALVVVSKIINKKTLNYYSTLLPNETIYFVSPEEIPNKEEFSNIIFKNDNFFLKRKDYLLIDKTPRPNWYYQQFLKYAIVLKLGYDIVHIVDGDSFIKKEIIFSDKIYYSNKIIENKYNVLIEHLMNKKSFSNRNYITNQMCFEYKYLFSLIQNIGFNEQSWVNGFCELLIDNEEFWFSEYQLYANYVLQNKSLKENTIKVFRRFDLISDSLNNGFNNYDILATEPQHKTSLLRKLRAKLLYQFKLNFG